MAAAMFTVQYVIAKIGLGNISAMLGALAGILTGALQAQLQSNKSIGRNREQKESKSQVLPQGLYKLAPYGILIVIIFAVNFIPVLNDLLNQISVQVQIPELVTGDHTIVPATQTKALSVFGHPGAILVYAAVLTLLLAIKQNRLPPGSSDRIRKGVLRSGLKSSVGILTMMAMATTMQNAGMVSQLSTTMAQVSGRFYPLVTPFIGALGAFMTGSNTNSNVLFGAFQQQVALTLSLNVPLILAIHNAGAAVGSVFAPAKIIVGCSTVGLEGQESDALRHTTRFGLIIIVILAVIGSGAASFL
jgi:lactate permease